MGFRRTLRKVLGYKEPDKLLNTSYAQEGEDLVLNRIFENKPKGYFIDVGALHPIRFSNTYSFYMKGWRGINIDATPGSMGLFQKVRPLDINLEIPVSDKIETLPYYIFNEPALNTFIKEIAEERSRKSEFWITNIINIETHSLSEILDEHMPINQEIDFLTIDAEGFDFQILRSNNWSKFKPKIVLFESEFSLLEMMDSPMDDFMKKHSYSLYAKTVKTFFYKVDSFSIGK